MAKKRSKWTYSIYLKRLKEGRGSGEGKNYKPWITIHDFASRGSVSRIMGRKTCRIHHLFSHLESDLFYIFDNREDIYDIREQFPLRLSDTLRLSAELNIRHPFLPGCDFPFVMTTDFLLTMADGTYRAYSVKSSQDLQNRRTMDKLFLEKMYWEHNKIYWRIITEKEINREKASNLRWLHYGDSFFQLVPPDIQSSCLRDFLILYQNSSISFSDILEIIEDGYVLPKGTGIAIFKHLICSGQIYVDINKHINTTEPRGGSILWQTKKIT